MISTTQRGWARYRSQAYQEALTDFTRALADDPHDYSAALGAGRSHRLLGQLDDAVAAFSRANDLRPGEARPLVERGAIRILQRHGPFHDGWCWGFANRAIRGSNQPSNHSWGLAVDRPGQTLQRGAPSGPAVWAVQDALGRAGVGHTAGAARSSRGPTRRCDRPRRPPTSSSTAWSGR